jgi:hypothetical protein
VILDGLTAGTSDLQSAGLVSAEALDAIAASQPGASARKGAVRTQQASRP